MKLCNIVKQLRIMESECEGETLLLPAEMVKRINHVGDDGDEVEWELADVSKMIGYMADMLD